jgi:hypothetical protein
LLDEHPQPLPATERSDEYRQPHDKNDDRQEPGHRTPARSTG